MSAKADPDMKDAILSALDVMRKKEIAEKQPFKARAYKKAMDGIALLTEVTCYEDVKDVEGIGKQIEEKIKEILATGKLASAERAIASHAVHEELMGVYGIGPSKAKELIASGIDGISSLREAVIKNPSILNDKQKIGLKYYEDLQLRIPYEEMIEHQEMLREFLPDEIDKEKDFEIVGSFRRESPDSGDIDVLIRSDSKTVLSEYIEMLKGFGYLVESLAHGDKKFMGICQLADKKARRLDILITSPEEYPYAILYFTGSDAFNIAMRRWALDKGYTLNEHRLQPLVGALQSSSSAGTEPPEMETERDIFRFLGIKYVHPRDRKASVALKKQKKYKIVKED